MGCFFPSNTQNYEDKDISQKSQMKGSLIHNNPNTFHRNNLDGPDFKVERKDSIGQAAKDYTTQILNAEAKKGINPELLSEDKDDYEGQRKKSDDQIYPMGTFGASTSRLELSEKQRDNTEIEDFENRASFGTGDVLKVNNNMNRDVSVSFGGINIITDQKFAAPQQKSLELNYSAEQLPHDKTPASPVSHY